MTGPRAPLGIVLALALAIGALTSAAAAPAPPPDPSRQVLVLVKLAPPHYRPGGYAGGYGDAMTRKERQRVAERIARSNRLTLVEDWPMPLLGLDCYVMEVRDDRSPETVANLLSHDPGVEWSEPMRLYHGRGEAPPYKDPLFLAQPAASAWRLADLHRLATGKDVLVAVIDSAVQRDHPDLVGQVTVTQDFTSGPPRAAEQHGTAVAGLIAARADNGVGIVGVAPQARLMALRACRQMTPGATAAGSPTVCDSLTLAKAISFAVEGHAQVINLSLAGPPAPLLAKLLDLAMARGASVVGAYDPALPGGGFPASLPGVIAVADESLASPKSGVYIAPGRDVPTTEPGGRWFLVSGSSYAAAQVSGLVALVRERRRAGGRVMLISSRPDGGLVDACATVLARSEHCGCACFLGREKVAIRH